MIIIILIIIILSIIITITIIDFLYLRSLISMILSWVSFLGYPNIFGIKDFVAAVVDIRMWVCRLRKRKKMTVSKEKEKEK
jgi:hypothetical protein